MNARQKKMHELRAQARKLQQASDELFKEAKALETEQAHEDYPCSCVKLNETIEVYDMGEQARRGRECVALLGMVYQNLSARKDCEVCKGTGKPNAVPSL